jgi:hypothetical protein
MITFGVILIFFSLGSLTLMIDMFIFHFSFWDAVENIFYSEITTDKVILYSTIFIGFLISFVTDVRRGKKQRKKSR